MGLKAPTTHSDLVGPNHADGCDRNREDLEATMGLVPTGLTRMGDGWDIEWEVVYMEWCTACGGAEWDYA